MKIGFYDSGMGGLSVLCNALCELRHESFMYYADVDRVPYGTKTKEQVIKFADEAVGFLVKNNAKAVVVACNTATSVAIDYLRSSYKIPILGMEPAVKPALLHRSGKRVLVIATPVTVHQSKLRNLLTSLDGEKDVDLLPMPSLVTFAENCEFDSPAVYDYVKTQFSQFDLNNYSHLVLGCTHFNYFKDTFAKVLPCGVEFTEGNDGTVRHLIHLLESSDALENNAQSVDYYFSGRKVTDKADLDKINICLKRLEKMRSITES